MNLGPNASMELGNEVQSVHGPSDDTSSLPFVNVAWHYDGAVVCLSACYLARNAERRASSTDERTLAPMFSEEDGKLRIQHGLHQELRLEDNTASRRKLLAFYQDEVDSPVIGGGGVCIAAGARLWEICCTIRFRKASASRAPDIRQVGSGSGRAKGDRDDLGYSLGREWQSARPSEVPGF